jgi:hypothetical protein
MGEALDEARANRVNECRRHDWCSGHGAASGKGRSGGCGDDYLWPFPRQFFGESRKSIELPHGPTQIDE